MLSRRTFLGGLGAAAAEAMQPPEEYGLQALLGDVGFVRIRAGEFSMGSADGAYDERPVHRVRITRAFELGKFEVTQSQWKTVMSSPHARSRDAEREPGEAVPAHFRGEALPVESVSWNDVQEFLIRLNARSTDYLFRLPTEAEWEYACRAGAAPEAGDGWCKAESNASTRAIGRGRANRWGLYDITGNVAEWVHDWYSGNYYEGSPRSDPKGPASGSYRIYRGGSWLSEARDCGASARGFDFPVSRFYNVGFRLAREAGKANNHG